MLKKFSNQLGLVDRQISSVKWEQVCDFRWIKKYPLQ